MGKVSIQGNARRGTNQRLIQIMERAAQSSPYDVVVFSGARPGGRRGSQHYGNNAIDVVLIDPTTGQELPNYKTASTYPQYEAFARQARRAQQEMFPEMSNRFRWGGWFNQGGPDLMHFDFGTQGMELGNWNTGLNRTGQQVYARQGNGYIYSHTQRAPAPTTRYANLWGREDFQVPQQQAGPDQNTIRLAQEALRARGVDVPVTGTLDDATQAGLQTFRASPGGMAFAEQYGLPVQPVAPQSASQPQTSADAANMMAGQPPMLDTRPQRSVPGARLAYGAEAQPYRGAAPGTNPADMLQPAAATARPPVQMQIGPGQQFVLPSLAPPPAAPPPLATDPNQQMGAMQRPAVPTPAPMPAPAAAPWDEPVNRHAAVTPDSIYAPAGTPNQQMGAMRPPAVPVPAPAEAAPIMLDQIDTFTTMAPLHANASGQPMAPESANDATMVAARQPQADPLAQFRQLQDINTRINAALQGRPPLYDQPPVTAGMPAPGVPVVDVTSGQVPFPRPNPIPVAQRGRAGRTPNGYQWSHIPQRGGPTMLAVVTPQGRRWSTPIGPPGGAGLFNEFASSFIPVIRG